MSCGKFAASLQPQEPQVRGLQFCVPRQSGFLFYSELMFGEKTPDASTTAFKKLDVRCTCKIGPSSEGLINRPAYWDPDVEAPPFKPRNDVRRRWCELPGCKSESDSPTPQALVIPAKLFTSVSYQPGKIVSRLVIVHRFAEVRPLLLSRFNFREKCRSCCYRARERERES